MGAGKGLNQPKAKIAGLDEIDLPTNETDRPPTYFAGVAKLNVSWIMQPVITKVVPVSGAGKGK